MISVRLKILSINRCRSAPSSIRLPKAKGIATPTINKKNGKTQSVGVQPCQGAWRKGGYTYSQVPGVFTKIIPAIVIPRKTSSATSRLLCSMSKGFRFDSLEIKVSILLKNPIALLNCRSAIKNIISSEKYGFHIPFSFGKAFHLCIAKVMFMGLLRSPW